MIVKSTEKLGTVGPQEAVVEHHHEISISLEEVDTVPRDVVAYILGQITAPETSTQSSQSRI